MRNMFRQLVVASLLVLSGCSDGDEMKFEGILLRSPDNLELGTIGSRDINDWKNNGPLSEEVLHLLDATPDQSLAGTGEATINLFGGYPNPAKNSFTFRASVTGGPCVFRYVVVNEKMKVLFSGSNVGNDQAMSFDISDNKKFPHNTVIRMYYSFSCEGNPDFYSGHGDILICHASSCRGPGNL